jgi:hypothetical protein
LAAPAGSGEALTIASHPSRAAVRAALASPLAAFSQIDSRRLLVACESVGSLCMPSLHCATAADAEGVVADAEGVVAAPVVAVELDPVDPLVAAELLELLELELLELPQPAISAVAASSTSADGKSFRIKLPPW